MTTNFTTDHVFSATTLWFYAVQLQNAYETSGSWPVDAVAVTDDIWKTYTGMAPPSTKLGAGPDGLPIWLTLPKPVVSLAQQAQTMLTQGLTVTSTAPAVSGLYAIDPVAQGKIGAISTYILVNGTFPNGASTYPWLDFYSVPHIFVSTAMFQQFATAVADFVAALDLIIATNSGTLPGSTITIA